MLKLFICFNLTRNIFLKLMKIIEFITLGIYNYKNGY